MVVNGRDIQRMGWTEEGRDKRREGRKELEVKSLIKVERERELTGAEFLWNFGFAFSKQNKNVHLMMMMIEILLAREMRQNRA